MHTRLRGLADEVLFFFSASSFAGAYINIPMRLSSEDMERGGTNPYNTIAMAAILAGLIVLGVANWRRFIVIARQAHLVNLFILLAAISAIWSFDPSVTLRRVLTLNTTIAFGYYALMRFSMSGIIRRIAVVTFVSAVASAAVAIGAPGIGVMDEGNLAGDWNGVFTHKQELGWTMFLGALCLVWLCTQDKGWRRVAYCAAIALFLGCIVMAKSDTSLLSVAILPAVITFTLIGRLSRVARIWAVYLFAIAAILCAVIVATNLNAIMAFIDRDVTLTGRVPLWGVLLELAAERPWTGYGYGAFWLETNPTAHYIWDVIGWPAPEAHNSYVDLMIQVGIPGMLLSTAILFGTIRGGLAAIADRVPWATFATSYVIILSITNLVETMLFHAGDIQCLMLPMLYAALRLHRSDAGRLVAGAGPAATRNAHHRELAQVLGSPAQQPLR